MEDWSEESDSRFNDAEEENTEYDLSVKSDRIAGTHIEEIKHVGDVNQSLESNKAEEVALVEQSEQIKRHNKLKEDHKVSTEKILSIKESWKKSVEEIELLKHQLCKLSKNLEIEKIDHALTQLELTKVKSCKTMVKKLVSERGNGNKTGLGFTHESMPESITNTVPENFNTIDHSPENEARLKEFLKKKSDDKH
ncbi:hypothetical protein QVD17_19582 [Tagetes erecta]|uniref:Uncharacterized protein n=1 Tax=Tagetes erecta TaxID=13708 RepID=A0AAD8KK21_TARER|nr:hypothetical protein QVD17_19582 [Tagetes erecta]